MGKLEKDEQRRLSASSPNIALREWQYRWDHKNGIAHFNHSKLGTISIKKNDRTQEREKFPYIAVHNGAMVGRYTNPQEATIGVANYVRTLGPKDTRLMNMPSGALVTGNKKPTPLIAPKPPKPEDNQKSELVKAQAPIDASKENSDAQSHVTFKDHLPKKIGGAEQYALSKQDIAKILSDFDNNANWEHKLKARGSTTLSRKDEKPSPPIKHFVDRNPSSEPLDILYHGAGFDIGSGKYLSEGGKHKVDLYDKFSKHPNVSTQLPNKKYHRIVSNYTLNTVPKDVGRSILQEIHDRLHDNGQAVISVRGKSDLDKAAALQKLRLAAKVKKDEYSMPKPPGSAIGANVSPGAASGFEAGFKQGDTGLSTAWSSIKGTLGFNKDEMKPKKSTQTHVCDLCNQKKHRFAVDTAQKLVEHKEKDHGIKQKSNKALKKAEDLQKAAPKKSLRILKKKTTKSLNKEQEKELMPLRREIKAELLTKNEEIKSFLAQNPIPENSAEFEKYRPFIRKLSLSPADQKKTGKKDKWAVDHMAIGMAIAGRKYRETPDRFKPSFTFGNAKTMAEGIATFDLPAVKTCPGSDSCKDICFADYGQTRNFDKIAKYSVNHFSTFHPEFENNLDNLIKDLKNYKENGKDSRDWSKIFRFHAYGDFKSPEYASKVANVMSKNPQTKFYAYTKSYAVDPIRDILFKASDLLPNFTVRQSVGSKFNDKIDPKRPIAVIAETDDQVKNGIANGFINCDGPGKDSLASEKKNHVILLKAHGSGKNKHSLEKHLRGMSPELHNFFTTKLGAKTPVQKSEVGEQEKFDISNHCDQLDELSDNQPTLRNLLKKPNL